MSEREAVQEHSTSLQQCFLAWGRSYSPDLHSLLDPHGRELLEDPVSAMMLSLQEWGEVVEKGGRIKPFMDTILQHDAAKYQEFIRGLFDHDPFHQPSEG